MGVKLPPSLQPKLDKKTADIIDKGGKTTEESTKKMSKYFPLNLPVSMREMIDAECATRIPNIGVNQWILEAIAKKLKL